MGGEGIFPAEWVDNIPTWLRIVMLVIAFPVVTVVAFLLFGYLSALLYSPLFLVRWLRRRRAQVGEAGARTGTRLPHVGGIPARHRSAGPGGAGRHQPDLTGCGPVPNETLQISRHPGRCLRSSMCSWTSA